MTRWGMVIDLARCIGCNACTVACQIENGSPPGVYFTRVYTEETGTYPDVETTFVPALCNHCEDAPCIPVCPTGATYKRDDGIVMVDQDKCIGCRYCMVACPFNVPRYEWHSPVPAVRKCDMCIDRQKDGKPTACAEACRFEATLCGTRDELIAEARKRIAEDPDMYYDHIYGEKELGGTNVLFLTPFPVESLGYKAKLGETPLPALTWNVLEKLPGVVVVGGAALSAFWWITNRRDEVASAKLAARKGDGAHGAPEASSPSEEAQS